MDRRTSSQTSGRGRRIEESVPERLQKVLAKAGLASRRQVEKYIAAGRVKVNGVTVTEQGIKITRRDLVEVDGKKVNLTRAQPLYFLLNKPAGVLSTARDEHGRKTVRDLLPAELGRIYPVGRLDYETTGLIILTNDGDLALKLSHPRYGAAKTYRARLDRELSLQDLAALQRGIELEDGLTAPVRIKKLSRLKPTPTAKSSCGAEITLREGRNRQVRRMFEHFNYQVLDLERVAYGSLTLGGLKSGQYRPLSSQEVGELRKEFRRSKPQPINNSQNNAPNNAQNKNNERGVREGRRDGRAQGPTGEKQR